MYMFLKGRAEKEKLYSLHLLVFQVVMNQILMWYIEMNILFVSLPSHQHNVTQHNIRSQKHYPAPLAIPLPNYSSYDGKELERQASQRFGTIPRVTKIHDSRSEPHETHEKR